MSRDESKIMYTKYAELRDKKGLTDYKMAQRTGISKSAIYAWKRGEYQPKFEKLLTIATVLECSPEIFISEIKPYKKERADVSNALTSIEEVQQENRKYNKYVELRDAKNFTDYKVSKLTGIQRSTFSDWKSGRSEPKADKLLAIAKVLECPVEQLIKPYKAE